VCFSVDSTGKYLKNFRGFSVEPSKKHAYCIFLRLFARVFNSGNETEKRLIRLNCNYESGTVCYSVPFSLCRRRRMSEL
jgi:hypothetical protein